MALDDRDKRYSAISFDQVYILGAPNPDGGLANSFDRQQIARKYAGIDTSIVVGAVKNLLLLGVG